MSQGLLILSEAKEPIIRHGQTPSLAALAQDEEIGRLLTLSEAKEPIIRHGQTPSLAALAQDEEGYRHSRLTTDY